MPWEIAKMLADYLEVPHYQVVAWDGDVIDCMLNDHHALSAFKHGSPQTRWDIYHSIKYAGIA